MAYLYPQIIPPGAILPYGGSSAPTGFLMCDGSAVSETTYAALFAVIGHLYGGDPGGGNFRVPDLRQKFPLGKAASGTGSTLGGTGGSIDHSHSLSAHYHNVDIAAFDSGGPSGSATVQSGTGVSVASAAHSHTSVNPPLTSTGPPDTDYTDGDNPPFLALNYIIRT